jgi:hypothetical protein
MVSLIATESYPYAGRSLSAGDAFDASEKDANLLKLLKKAVDAPQPVLRTRTMAPAERSADEPKPKRTYRRRDLVPESAVVPPED